MAIAFHQVFGSIVGDVFNHIEAKSDAYFKNQYNQRSRFKMCWGKHSRGER